MSLPHNILTLGMLCHNIIVGGGTFTHWPAGQQQAGACETEESLARTWGTLGRRLVHVANRQFVFGALE